MHGKGVNGGGMDAVQLRQRDSLSTRLLAFNVSRHTYIANGHHTERYKNMRGREKYDAV